jgi:response regulator RpfG family c-di-GMP phosphodiesterase
MTEHEPTYELLVVDDESYICNIVTEALSAFRDYHVVSFSDPQQALIHIENNRVDLVLTDLVMGDYSGVQVLERALNCHPDCIVILMTAFPTVNNAISVLKKGAYDYLVKPFKLETLKNAVKRGLQHQDLARENLQLKEQLGLYRLSEAMGSATSLEDVLDMAAETAVSIIGTGAVSILVREPSTGDDVPFVIRGEPADAETADFLLGKHRICGDSLQDQVSQLAVRKIKGKQPIVRSLAAHPLMSRGKALGLLNVVQDNHFIPLRRGQLHLLSIIASKIAAKIENSRLYEDLQSSYLESIKALANAIEARDQHTRGHTERVTVLADLIAEQMGWSDKQRAELKMGCTLHDIGKIGVPDAILNKPNHLTDEERQAMEYHPELGAKILEGIDYLKPAIPYVLYHHERYDGAGYPRGLSGEDIPIEGRLLAVVDTYDAIVSNRPYRRGASPEKAITELQLFSGKQFDPEIVEVLVQAWKDGLIEKLGIYDVETEPTLSHR